MSKMFDKYTNSIEFTPITPYRPYKEPHKVIGTGAVRLIKDVNGNEVGVEAPRGSNFALFFTFDGYVDDYLITDFLNESNVILNLYDNRRNLVYQTEAEIDENVAITQIVSDGDTILPYGNYYMELVIETDEFKYIIINDHDAILTII